MTLALALGMSLDLGLDGAGLVNTTGEDGSRICWLTNKWVLKRRQKVSGVGKVLFRGIKIVQCFRCKVSEGSFAKFIETWRCSRSCWLTDRKVFILTKKKLSTLSDIRSTPRFNDLLTLHFWWQYNKTNNDCFISGNGEIHCYWFTCIILTWSFTICHISTTAFQQ